MKVRNIIHCTAAVLWPISAVYLVYTYYLKAGYWEHPLYISLFLYLIVLMSKKGFNKINLFIFFFYAGFGIWFVVDLLLAIGGAFSVD